MEENIEVKDVQKTEYLDKNGLDMLWAKVKENTRNQVEVERNRAVAKENSIADKIDNFKYIPYYNKYTDSEIQYYQLTNKEGVQLSSYGVNTKLSGDDIKIYSGSESSTISRSRIGIDSYSGNNGNHFSVNVNSQPELILYDSESRIKAKIFTNSHTPVISISKNTLSGQGDDLQLGADGIKMLSKTTKDIVTANSSTAHIGLDDDQTEYTYIAPLENGKVPAEYLDLSQYAKKSEIADKVDTTALTALEQKVTANTTAIEGKQDAGNYIPYNMLAFKNKYVIEPSYSIEFRTDALNNKYGKAFIGPQIISITSASGQNTAVEPEEISIKQSGNASGRIHSTLNVDSFGVYNNSDDSVIFKLNQYGIKLEDGDDNHVLTSNASTIDIREYALKSVYDKKIASLEARIAALEAKHAETA